MNIDSIRELAFKHLGQRKAHHKRETGFIFYHGERVGKIAVRLREILIPGDTSKDEIMMAAGYFHDIAKGIEPHGQYGAVLAKEILNGYCEPDEIDEIVELIRCHQLRKKEDNYSEYVKIIQDADILDHFGTIEIWMNFQYYAYKDKPIKESVKFYNEEFDEHIQEVRELLNFEVSHKIFDDKIKFQKMFTDRLALEANGEICI